MYVLQHLLLSITAAMTETVFPKFPCYHLFQVLQLPLKLLLLRVFRSLTLFWLCCKCYGF